MQELLLVDHAQLCTPSPTKLVFGLEVESREVLRTRTVLRESVAALELHAAFEDPVACSL